MPCSTDNPTLEWHGRHLVMHTVRMRTEEAPLTAARRTSGLTLGLDSRPSYQRYSNVYDKI